MSKVVTPAAVAAALALGAVGVAAQAAATPALSDPQVAHVAVTANAIDVGMGRLALRRAGDTDVRSFARTMIRDHTAVNRQAAALAKRLGVTPLDNDVSRKLEAGAREARARLTKLNGTAFDRAYMQREVGYHQAVLDALDHLLIPSARNAELKKLLEGVRPVIAAHLERARAIQARLEGR